MCEILAPSGNPENLITAINNGADAIYLGMNDFSARKGAENFNFENIYYYITYAKIFKVKIYVAVNTLIKDTELDLFFDTIIKSYNLGADAFILQDLFLGKLLKEKIPDIVLHLSTQAGINNVYGARVAKQYGFSRVILARETSLTEIFEISKIIETEVFVQGALCSSFSGQCYMSSFIGGNSGNRGLCKQPCRKIYKITDKNNNIIKNSFYNISLCDLCLKDEIDSLKSAGVYSFKIEGRMRRSEYVAASIRLYKKVLNGETSEKSYSDLKRTYNRGNFTKGYLYGAEKNILSDKIQNHMGEMIGKIKTIKNNLAFVESNHKSVSLDAFKIIRNEQAVGSMLVKNENNSINGFYADFNGDIKINDLVYITTDIKLNKSLLSEKKVLKISIIGFFKEGEKAKIIAEFSDRKIEYLGKKILQKAKNSPLTIQEIKNNLLRIDSYPFEIIFLNFELDNIFIPKSELNEMRRELYLLVFTAFNFKRTLESDIFIGLHSNMSDIVYSNYAVIASNFSFLNNCDLFLDKIILFPYDYKDIKEFESFKKDTEFYKGEKYLYLPAYLNSDDIDIIKSISKYFDGFYCQGNYSLLDKENSINTFLTGKTLFLGTGLNIFNKIDCNNLSDKIYVLSQELNINELSALISNNNYVFTLGNIETMQFIYCPLGKNCSNCINYNIFNLVDENNRKFKVRRYKLSSCRFIMYNSYDLVSEAMNSNRLYNFTLYDNDKIIKILHNISNVSELKNIIVDYTKGHFLKGIN